MPTTLYSDTSTSPPRPADARQPYDGEGKIFYSWFVHPDDAEAAMGHIMDAVKEHLGKEPDTHLVSKNFMVDGVTIAGIGARTGALQVDMSLDQQLAKHSIARLWKGGMSGPVEEGQVEGWLGEPEQKRSIGIVLERHDLMPAYKNIEGGMAQLDKNLCNGIFADDQFYNRRASFIEMGDRINDVKITIPSPLADARQNTNAIALVVDTLRQSGFTAESDFQLRDKKNGNGAKTIVIKKDALLNAPEKAQKFFELAVAKAEQAKAVPGRTT